MHNRTRISKEEPHYNLLSLLQLFRMSDVQCEIFRVSKFIFETLKFLGGNDVKQRQQI